MVDLVNTYPIAAAFVVLVGTGIVYWRAVYLFNRLLDRFHEPRQPHRGLPREL